MSTSKESPLTSEQVQTFLRDGIVVVPLLSSDELREAQHGLIETLSKEFGVDVQDLERTGIGLMDASSTNGAGELDCNTTLFDFFAICLTFTL